MPQVWLIFFFLSQIPNHFVLSIHIVGFKFGSGILFHVFFAATNSAFMLQFATIIAAIKRWIFQLRVMWTENRGLRGKGYNSSSLNYAQFSTFLIWRTRKSELLWSGRYKLNLCLTNISTLKCADLQRHLTVCNQTRKLICFEVLFLVRYFF